MPGLKILCVFDDTAFAAQGFAALQKTSYLLTRSATVEEAERELTRQNFQIVVLGPGLDRSGKERLAIKSWEFGCAVIIACSDERDTRICADAHVQAKESGPRLVDAVVKAVTAKFFAVAA